jgi:hypothetical protein
VTNYGLSSYNYRKLFRHPWSWLFFIIDFWYMSMLTIIRLYHWKKSQLHLLVSTVRAIIRNSTYKCWP